MTISGYTTKKFGPVRDAFAANFERTATSARPCCVYHHGRAGRRPVGRLGGPRARAAPGSGTRLQLVFSATKGVTATCVHLLVERGALDLDAPVARYWPEFAAEGKGDIPLRWVMSHRAGARRGRRRADARRGAGLGAGGARPSPRRRRTGSRAPRTATTRAPTAGSSARWCAASPVAASAASSPTRSPAPLGLDFFIGLPAARAEPRVARALSAARVDDAERARGASRASSVPTRCSAG